jgi:hypothetical protein
MVAGFAPVPYAAASQLLRCAILLNVTSGFRDEVAIRGSMTIQASLDSRELSYHAAKCRQLRGIFRCANPRQ